MTKRAGKEGRREKDKSPPFFISPSTCHLPPSLKEISKVGIGTGLDEEGWNGTTSCTLNFRPPIFTEQSIASTPSLQPTEENNMTSCMYAFRACAVSFMGLMRLCEMHKKLKEACVQSEQGKNDLHASIRALEKKLRKTEEELALVKTALSNSQVQKKGRVRTAKSSAPRQTLFKCYTITHLRDGRLLGSHMRKFIEGKLEFVPGREGRVQKLTKEDGSLLSKANMEYVGSNPSAKIQGGAFVPLDCWKCLILLLFCTEATFYFRGGLDFYWDSFLQAVVDLPLIVLLQS